MLDKVKIDTPGGRKGVMQEVQKSQTFTTFMDETATEVSGFLKHDFVARWQGDLYHSMLFGGLEEGSELWISDYIENFHTFSNVELQQDYYHKTQVAIFIVLVIRHREPHEAVLPSEVHTPCTCMHDSLTCWCVFRLLTSCRQISLAMCMCSFRATGRTMVL